MSSARPNIQQIPRPTKSQSAPGGDGGERGMIIADPGCKFIAADFSGVEIRIAAAVTGDATLAGMVRDGVDLHAEIARLVWEIDPAEPGFGDLRARAKSSVFGYLYGAGLARMRTQLAPHGDRAEQVIATLTQLTPTLMEWDGALRTAVRARRVTQWVYPSGRAVYFDNERPHKALNTVVQGYGRELLVDAMLRWEAVHPGCPVIPVHDELVIQVPAAHAEEWTHDLVACMTTSIGTGSAQVPITCEADPPSARWGTVE
jgi:DNA polymerase-1